VNSDINDAELWADVIHLLVNHEAGAWSRNHRVAGILTLQQGVIEKAVHDTAIQDQLRHQKVCLFRLVLNASLMTTRDPRIAWTKSKGMWKIKYGRLVRHRQREVCSYSHSQYEVILNEYQTLTSMLT